VDIQAPFSLPNNTQHAFSFRTPRYASPRRLMPTSLSSSPLPELGRSSRATPRAWYAGHSDFAQGVPLWAQDRVEDFRHLFRDDRCTIAHEAARIPSRLMPSYPYERPDYSQGSSEIAQHTRRIESVLERASNPVLISVGGDGLPCNTDRILHFLNRHQSFEFVVWFPRDREGDPSAPRIMFPFVTEGEREF